MKIFHKHTWVSFGPATKYGTEEHCTVCGAKRINRRKHI